MTEKLTKAHRLIDRENILREGEQEPQSQSVEKTIAFLTDDEILPDGRVREYLLQSSERYFRLLHCPTTPSCDHSPGSAWILRSSRSDI